MAQLGLDFVIVFVFGLLVGVPSSILIHTYSYISALPYMLSLPIMVFLFLLSFLCCLAFISHVLPHPKPGKYTFPFHKQSVLWSLHFAVQRIAMFPIWYNVFLSFNTLKFLLTKALGGNIDFQTWTSSNIELSEIYLITIKKNAMIGGGADLGCHFMRDGKLILAPIVIEEGAQILLEAKIGPDCRVGKKSVLGVSSKLGYKVHIGESTVIGNGCVLQTHVTIGDNVTIGDFVNIESAVSIESGVKIPSSTWIRQGAKISKDTKFDDLRWQTITRKVPLLRA